MDQLHDSNQQFFSISNFSLPILNRQRGHKFIRHWIHLALLLKSIVEKSLRLLGKYFHAIINNATYFLNIFNLICGFLFFLYFCLYFKKNPNLLKNCPFSRKLREQCLYDNSEYWLRLHTMLMLILFNALTQLLCLSSNFWSTFTKTKWLWRFLKVPTLFFLRILFFFTISRNIKSCLTSIKYFIPFREFISLL